MEAEKLDMMKSLKELVCTLIIVSLSPFVGAGVDDQDMPSPEASGDFEAYGGTVKILITEKRQAVLDEQNGRGQLRSKPAPLVNQPSSNYQMIPDVVFVGMHETSDGHRVAEVYFQGNILHYHRSDRLPNKEMIKSIEDRVLTTNVRQYWLSPTPSNLTSPSIVSDSLVPVGLIQ